MPEVYAALWVIGDDLDPAAIADGIGLVPRSAHRRGDPMPNGRTFREGSCWFTTGDRPRTTIEASLDDLFGDLDSGWPYLLQIRAATRLFVECYVKVYGGEADPFLGFEARHVARAAELGGGMGVDYQDFRASGLISSRPTPVHPH